MQPADKFVDYYGRYPHSNGPPGLWMFNPGDPHGLGGARPPHGSPITLSGCGSCTTIPKYWKLKVPKAPTGGPLGLEYANWWSGEFILEKEPWPLFSAHGLLPGCCWFRSVLIPKEEWGNPTLDFGGGPIEIPYEDQPSWALIQASWTVGQWFILAFGAAWATIDGHTGEYFDVGLNPSPDDGDGDQELLLRGLSEFHLLGARFKCREKNEFFFFATDPADPHPYSAPTVDTSMRITVEPFYP